ncbi:MAG: cyclic nucleotide-binding protein [Bacteriovoracaceae bacterium]|nr:cyclic nucleotide-binding protein [Bacteriovoracaceae bacterium]
MERHKELVTNLPLFSTLTSPEIDLVLGSSKPVTYQEKEIIFSEGDAGGALFILLEGAVTISTTVQEDIEKPLATLKPGSVFGEVSLIDQNPREVKATAIGKSLLLILEAESFEKLLQNQPALGTKILKIITRTVVDRIRLTTDQYRRNVKWGLGVSGALDMNWTQLVTDEIDLSLTLSNGTNLSGSFMKVEKNETSYEFYLRDKKNKILIIPYHAVLSISFNRDTAGRFKGSKEES